MARCVAGVLSRRHFVEAVGDHIEERGEHDGEQRKRDRAIELRHAQIGQHERQQRRHDGCQRVQAGGADRQRSSAPEPQDGHSTDGECRERGEGQELRYVLGQPQHAFERRREQPRVGRRLEPWPGGDRPQRNDARQRGSRCRRRAAPSGSAEDRHGDDGEGRPPGIHARCPEGQDGKHRQGRKCGGGDPVGLRGIVGNGQVRLDGHERGGERELDGNVDEQRRRPRNCRRPGPRCRSARSPRSRRPRPSRRRATASGAVGPAHRRHLRRRRDRSRGATGWAAGTR